MISVIPQVQNISYNLSSLAPYTTLSRQEHVFTESWRVIVLHSLLIKWLSILLYSVYNFSLYNRFEANDLSPYVSLSANSRRNAITRKNIYPRAWKDAVHLRQARWCLSINPVLSGKLSKGRIYRFSRIRRSEQKEPASQRQELWL